MLLLVCESITKEQKSEMRNKIIEIYGNEVLEGIYEYNKDLADYDDKLYKICTRFNYKYMPLHLNSIVCDMLLFFSESEDFAKSFLIDTKMVYKWFYYEFDENEKCFKFIKPDESKENMSHEIDIQIRSFIIDNFYKGSDCNLVVELLDGLYALNPRLKLWGKSKKLSQFYNKYKYILSNKDLTYNIMLNLYLMIIDIGIARPNKKLDYRWWFRMPYVNDNDIAASNWGDVFGTGCSGRNMFYQMLAMIKLLLIMWTNVLLILVLVLLCVYFYFDDLCKWYYEIKEDNLLMNDFVDEENDVLYDSEDA